MTGPLIDRAVVASKNPNKIAEIQSLLLEYGILGEVVQGCDWPDIVEDADTLVGNSRLKAHGVSAHTGLCAIADDTGLEVEALGGAPGVYTARFAGPQAGPAENVAALLDRMRGVEGRSATFRTVVVVAWADGAEVVAEGHTRGQITTVPRGRGGFGYDPVFEIGERTLAEMSLEEKHRVGHRGKAMRDLAAALSARVHQRTSSEHYNAAGSLAQFGRATDS